MKPDGVAFLFGPGLADGPFPEHYEPLEGPLAKNLMSAQLSNPVFKIFTQDMTGGYSDVIPSSPLSAPPTRSPSIGVRQRDPMAAHGSPKPSRRSIVEISHATGR